MAAPLRALALAAACLSLARAVDPAADRIAALPRAPAQRSRQFSGYLAGASPSRFLHYYLVESERDPAADDFIFFFNGGPGCSSLIAAFLELGPLQMGGDGALRENPSRWNAQANVVFLESPPGVGFSYDAAAPLPLRANDTSTAADSLAALRDLFSPAGWPLGARGVWLAGESYAGLYVPWLARAVLGSPLAPALRGILVGNGALKTADAYEGNLTALRTRFLFEHALFAAPLKAEIDAACTNWTAPRAPACDAALARVPAQTGPLNTYDIEVTCSAQARALQRSADPSAGSAAAAPAAALDPCTDADAALTAYMNEPAVQAALHVARGAAALGAWGECAGGGALAFTREPCDETVEVYPALLGAIDVLVFNGDQDVCIPYLQDAQWTRDMGLPVRREWRPWLVAGQVAGYVTEFAAGAARRFAFATVKQAGHEVPMYQGARALAMVQRFVAGAEL